MKIAVIYGLAVTVAVGLAWVTLLFVEHPALVWPFVSMQGCYIGWVFRSFVPSQRRDRKPASQSPGLCRAGPSACRPKASATARDRTS